MHIMASSIPYIHHIAPAPFKSSSPRNNREKGARKKEMGSFSAFSTPSVSSRNPRIVAEEEDLPTLESSVQSTLRNSFMKKDPWRKNNKKKDQVFLEGYVEAGDEVGQLHGAEVMTRTKSLTDGDLDELKGCLDLGFGFSYEEIPELCNTLPALELCYSMSQRFLDEQQKSPEDSGAATSDVNEQCSLAATPIANWKISSPGDHPEEVKARLKFWAQAVACTVKLCS